MSVFNHYQSIYIWGFRQDPPPSLTPYYIYVLYRIYILFHSGIYTLLYIVPASYYFRPLHLIIYIRLFSFQPRPQHAAGHIYGCKVTNKFPK